MVASTLVSYALPNDFGYVGLVGVGAAFLNVFQGMTVGKFRKSSGVGYPNYMATPEQAKSNPQAHLLNCAQRAHANTTENMPHFLFALTFVGLHHPRLAASFGTLWIIGRIFYTTGYITGDPAKRMSGLAPLHYVGFLGLVISSLYIAGTKIAASLK